MQLNKLEIHFEFVGDWHIGIIVNGSFVKYVCNQNIEIDIPSSYFTLDLVFLGKDHLQCPNNYAKIINIYYNDLEVNEAIKFSAFNSDNPQYKIITECNYINLNGVWSARFTEPNLISLIRQKIT